VGVVLQSQDHQGFAGPIKGCWQPCFNQEVPTQDSKPPKKSCSNQKACGSVIKKEDLSSFCCASSKENKHRSNHSEDRNQACRDNTGCGEKISITFCFPENKT